jgi:hypothetical protein
MSARPETNEVLPHVYHRLIKEQRFELTLIGLVLTGLSVALVILSLAEHPQSHVPDVVQIRSDTPEQAEDGLTFVLFDSRHALYLERHSGCLYARDRDLLTLHRKGGVPVCDANLIPKS